MANEIVVHSLGDMQTMAKAIAESGLFGMKSPQQALALMLVAQSENQHPATITQDYDIIQGKACRKTHSVLARFQLMGGKVEWHTLSQEAACATFSHPQGGSLRIDWTIEMARKANLTGKDNWKNYPRAMLRARVIAEGVRAIYPAAIGGMLVPEEADDTPIVQPERDITPPAGAIEQPAGKPIYPNEDFDEKFDSWRELINSGKRTAQEVIAKLESKYSLTNDQLRLIRNLEAVVDVEVDSFVSEMEAAEAAQ